MEKIKILETRFKRYPLLHFKEVPRETVAGTKLKAFIKDIFYKYNPKFKTYAVKSGERVAYQNTLRSFIDVYGLVRYYLGERDFSKVAKAMLELSKEKKLQGKWFCSTVVRYVFSTDLAYENYYLRMCEVTNDRTVTMTDVINELGFNKEDFKRT